MKRLIFALFAVFASAPGLAQSDFAVTFQIVGGITDQDFHTLQLDVDMGTNYLSAHGALQRRTDSFTPATGTCFSADNDSVFCNLQVDLNSYTLVLEKNLTGTLSVRGGPHGLVLDTAPITVTNIETAE